MGPGAERARGRRERLQIDGKTSIPPGINIAASWNSIGDCCYAAQSGDALDTLLRDPLMSDSKPHSLESVMALTLHALYGVELTPKRGERAMRDLIENNPFFSPVAHDGHYSNQGLMLAEAILGRPLNLASAPSCTRIGWRGLGKNHPQVAL